MMPPWFLEQQRMARAWADAIYQRWINEAMLSIYTEQPNGWYGPGVGRIEAIVGYDPQRLLPSPERVWVEDARRRFARYPLMTDEFDLLYPGLAIEDAKR